MFKGSTVAVVALISIAPTGSIPNKWSVHRCGHGYAAANQALVWVLKTPFGDNFDACDGKRPMG